MDKLKFIISGYEDDDHPRLKFIGTEFDSVEFTFGDLKFEENIPDTEDAYVSFFYTIISNSSTEPFDEEKFKVLLGALVRQIMEDAVKDL